MSLFCRSGTITRWYPKDVLPFVKFLNPLTVIPCHYNTFPVVEQDGAAFKRAIKLETKRPAASFWNPGERIDPDDQFCSPNAEMQRTAFQKKAIVKLAPSQALAFAQAFLAERGYKAGAAAPTGQVFVMGKAERCAAPGNRRDRGACQCGQGWYYAGDHRRIWRATWSHAQGVAVGASGRKQAPKLGYVGEAVGVPVGWGVPHQIGQACLGKGAGARGELAGCRPGSARRRLVHPDPPVVAVRAVLVVGERDRPVAVDPNERPAQPSEPRPISQFLRRRIRTSHHRRRSVARTRVAASDGRDVSSDACIDTERSRSRRRDTHPCRRRRVVAMEWGESMATASSASRMLPVPGNPCHVRPASDCPEAIQFRREYNMSVVSQCQQNRLDPR